MHGTICSGFWKVSVCCEWEILECVFGGVNMCCVWDCLNWIWGSEFVLCVGMFGVRVGK